MVCCYRGGDKKQGLRKSKRCVPTGGCRGPISRSRTVSLKTFTVMICMSLLCDYMQLAPSLPLQDQEAETQGRFFMIQQCNIMWACLLTARLSCLAFSQRCISQFTNDRKICRGMVYIPVS